MIELTDFCENDTPGYLISQAYVYLKEYDGIGKYVSPPLGVGLSGRVRELLRLWGNNNWP